MSRLIIDGTPRRHLYQDARDLPDLPAKESKQQLLEGFGDFASEAGGENSNLNVQLVTSPATSQLMANPPIGAPARAYTAVGEFVGLVQSVTLSDSGCSMSIEA